MVKKVFFKKIGSLTFLLVLLCSILCSLPDTLVTNIGKELLTSKQILSQSYINMAELCEETEVKSVIESLHEIPAIQLQYSPYSKQIVGSSFLISPFSSVVAFAGTTNFPIYIAKQSYLL